MIWSLKWRYTDSTILTRQALRHQKEHGQNGKVILLQFVASLLISFLNYTRCWAIISRLVVECRVSQRSADWAHERCVGMQPMAVTFLGLRRVHFSFFTCWLSLSHHVTNHPSISITWPITWPVTWPPTWPVTCHPVTCPSNVTCPMSPASRSPAHHLTLPYLIPHDSSYPWLVSIRLP